MPDERFKSQFLINFINSAKELVIPRKAAEKDLIPEQYRSLFHQIEENKGQQTLTFFNYVKSKVDQKQTYLDLGAGKGYLSSFLAFDQNEKAIAIEGSEKHAISLAKRISDLSARFYKNVFQQIVGKEVDSDLDKQRF